MRLIFAALCPKIWNWWLPWIALNTENQPICLILLNWMTDDPWIVGLLSLRDSATRTHLIFPQISKFCLQQHRIWGPRNMSLNISSPCVLIQFVSNVFDNNLKLAANSATCLASMITLCLANMTSARLVRCVDNFWPQFLTCTQHLTQAKRVALTSQLSLCSTYHRRTC